MTDGHSRDETVSAWTRTRWVDRNVLDVRLHGGYSAVRMNTVEGTSRLNEEDARDERPRHQSKSAVAVALAHRDEA